MVLRTDSLCFTPEPRATGRLVCSAGRAGWRARFSAPQKWLEPLLLNRSWSCGASNKAQYSGGALTFALRMPFPGFVAFRILHLRAQATEMDPNTRYVTGARHDLVTWCTPAETAAEHGTDVSKLLCSARPRVSNPLNATRDCPEPRIARGFALLPPDCDFGADAENRVSEPLLLKTS